MLRAKVSSKNLKEVGYDGSSGILEIEFNDGAIYHYFNVPVFVYNQLMSASSHGEFFNQNIRYNYRYQKVV